MDQMVQRSSPKNQEQLTEKGRLWHYCIAKGRSLIGVVWKSLVYRIEC